MFCMRNHLTRFLLNCMQRNDDINIVVLVDTVFVRIHHVNAINCDAALHATDGIDTQRK